MSDIVERLRDPVIRWMSTNQAERREAADEIERLREALKIVRVAVENFGMTGGNDRFALGYVDELARETLEAKDE